MARDGEMGGYLDVSSNGYAGRLEVIGGPTGRKRRSNDAKARIAVESLMPGASVAEVARKHEVTRWQVYDWRGRLRDGRLVVPDDVTALPTFAALAVEDPRPPKLDPTGITASPCRPIFGLGLPVMDTMMAVVPEKNLWRVSGL